MNDGSDNFLKKGFNHGVENRDFNELKDLGRNEINYFEENKDVLKPILILLEKAEQMEKQLPHV